MVRYIFIYFMYFQSKLNTYLSIVAITIIRISILKNLVSIYGGTVI